MNLLFFTALLLPSGSHETGKLALTQDQSDGGTSAYDETLPLIRPLFEAVFGTPPQGQATATAPDLRILLRMASGMGWTVLPDYLCAEAFASGLLVRLPMMRPGPDNRLYLAWNHGALRHPRVVHARDRLMAALASIDRTESTRDSP
ncbi:substrate-binding domain-containing protein [Methylobacterium organophilum]|uniref:LysR substrate-binding domain-containing protein n=1 Tax=Methylobacterium organophilum TaxID=410 RepID=UPI001F147E9E|nr:LysR substrate-binding domain-containing protein [Methylobacterium organophilum]UMY16752.1 substrate-binding domain-containing protein [Methylobacterium organophilum]